MAVVLFLAFSLTSAAAYSPKMGADSFAPKAKKMPKPSATHVLNEEPRIELYTGFIQSEDARALRNLAEGLGFEAQSEASQFYEVNGGDEVCVLNQTATIEEAIDEADAKLSDEGWLVASRVGEAAAEWAQLSSEGVVPAITRWEPWAPNFNRSGLLHLDSRMRPQHQRTVIVYLDEAYGERTKDLGSSGFTVFPCIETEDMDAKEVKRRHRLCSRAFRHVRLTHERLLKTHAQGLDLKPSKQLEYLKAHPELTALPKITSTGLRPVDWQWTAGQDAVAETHGAARIDSLTALAEAMCLGKAGGLRIEAKAGAALLFDGATRGRSGEMVPDWQTWHAGCSPRPEYGQRWTAQWFFDSPSFDSQPGKVCETGSVNSKRCRLPRNSRVGVE